VAPVFFYLLKSFLGQGIQGVPHLLIEHFPAGICRGVTFVREFKRKLHPILRGHALVPSICFARFAISSPTTFAMDVSVSTYAALKISTRG
jgi:hypothetical protein